ncbi:MAG: siderophore ABC transporter substrate-binding protein [Sulfitobacter sp.]
MRRFALACFAFALPAMVAAQSLTVQTATGAAELPAGAKTVAVLDLAAIDALSALGVAVAAVPDITPPAYLAEAMAGVPTVGSLFEPDFEALAVMQPDLIIAGGRSQPKVAALQRIAPTMDATMPAEDLLGAARVRLQSYGVLFDVEEAAAAQIEQLGAAAEQARAAAAGKGGALILMTNGGKISAFGKQSRFGWIHSELGVAEAKPDLVAENHGEAISFEFIADLNPDWIFVIDRSAAIGREAEAASAVLDNPLVSGTNAGKNGQIVYLDSAALYLAAGGPKAFRVIMDQIADAMGAAQ